ncbi:MAG TPA: GTPase Era [Acidimicrobiales bacterium]|nr:GTPase Era [Acidimicrobiales bacterium]
MTHAGFAAILGRPNVGKSTLLNQVVGTKVSITSPSPNTTRSAIRGILTDDDVQIIFVDTPGLHRPRTALGGRLNEMARAAVDDVDVIMAVIEAGAAIGPGDRAVLTTLLEATRREGGAKPCVVVNKIDRTGREGIAAQLLAAHEAVAEIAEERHLESAAARVEYFPVSAKTGVGTEELVHYVREAMPESPFLFPEDEVSDVPEAVWIAELVREQLVRKTKQELPHSIHCRVTEFEWPHVLVEILVERESQKGMVIGKHGQLLKDVGIAARRQLPEGCFLELRVRVEPGWQKRDDMLDRFGY